jgi:hypothetical protein
VTSLSDSQKDAVARALNLRADVRRFQQTWPTPNARDETVPPFTWAELERQLSSLAVNPQAALMTPDLIGATRKQAAFKPPEMVLREILCVAGTLMDESFLDTSTPCRAPSDIGEAPMT